MNSFKMNDGRDILIPSDFTVQGVKYKVYAKVWLHNDHRRLYITIFPPSPKEQGIQCGYVNLITGSMHIYSLPGWIGRLLVSKITFTHGGINGAKVTTIITE